MKTSSTVTELRDTFVNTFPYSYVKKNNGIYQCFCPALNRVVDGQMFITTDGNTAARAVTLLIAGKTIQLATDELWSHDRFVTVKPGTKVTLEFIQ